MGDGAKRNAVSLRLTDKTYARFLEATHRSGRSMAQELELRVLHSFAVEDMSDALSKILD